MVDERETSENLLKKIEKQRQLQEREQANIGWYFWLISEYPLLVIFLCSVIITAFTAIAIVYADPPDFSDPSKGFEIRGTPLSNKLVTWHNLINQTGYNLSLSNYPYAYIKRKGEKAQMNYVKSRSKGKHKKNRILRKNRISRSAEVDVIPPYTWDFREDGYFCKNPTPKYMKWSYEIVDDKICSLWSVEGMRSMCKSDIQLLTHKKYADICISQSLKTCCPVISLPNFVAYLANLSTCQDLTREALDVVETILRNCSPYYCQGSLKSDCWQSEDKQSNCPKVPKKCTDYNAVYSIFHFFLEQKVVCPFNLNSSLTHSIVFAPVFKHSGILPLYYDNFQKSSLSDGITRVFTMDFGIKDEVFELLLYADTVYPGIAMFAVLIIIFLYTGSIFITLMSLISTGSAMCMSYFFYAVVIDVKYFPFLNLTAVLVMMGISADNVLIFYSAWRNYAEEDARNLHQSIKRKHSPISCRVGVVVKRTMRHIAWSLFVTGSTTAAAFFSNYSSNVTAIKCFGLYTGLTVLTNLFLSLTWLPASIIIQHKHLNITCFRCQRFCKHFAKFWLRFSEALSELSRIFFHQIQVLLIVKLRYVWMIVYVALTAGSMCIVLVYPGLRLPATSTYFQYFKSSHPFEAYDLAVAHKFAFKNQSAPYLPVRVVFGVIPQDSGDSRDPLNIGPLTFHRRFNISHPRSQVWLLKFCKEMRNTSYYQSVEESESFSMCFIETFKDWMSSQKCALNNICCEQTFPYPPVVFEHCLKEAIYRTTVYPGMRLYSSSPGPRYDKNDVIRALIVEFRSTHKYSSSYEEIRQFYEDINDFLTPLLRKAPPGLAYGWFLSDLEFYSLQNGLHYGTISSVGWSILIALVVIIIVSRNFIVSIFAICSIAGIIFVTAALLVLMGWELNVLESITISIAVGLSVDFTAHYAIAYIKAQPRNDRQQRVECAATRLGPAITLAAITTFVAGAGMMPANVLAYTRFGVFLMIIMIVSWLYSSYCFLGMLSIMGPQGHCCSLPCNCGSVVQDNDEYTTIMTETSNHCTPPTSFHKEIVERATVM